MDMSLLQAHAAVAVIEWYSSQNDTRFLVLRRAECASDPWSGQLGLPGGHVDIQDASLLATCVRETREECGLSLHEDNLIGPLPIRFAGRHLGSPMAVQAYHFRIQNFPPLVLDPKEITEALWLSRAAFCDIKQHDWRVPLPGMKKGYPGFMLGGYFLWGFTYEVLRNLVGVEAPTNVDA